MNKKSLGLLVVLLTAVVLLSGCGKKISVVPAKPIAPAPLLEGLSGYYSINQLLVLNKPLKCTWREKIEQAEITNTMYLSGRKFYQDINLGSLGHAYAVSDGQSLYSWNDFSGLATKLDLAVAQEKATDQPAVTEANANLEQKREFFCERWNIDESLFNPPADKNFQDQAGLINQATGQAGSGVGPVIPQAPAMNSGLDLEKTRQLVCNLCRQEPNPEKVAECLKSANCK